MYEAHFGFSRHPFTLLPNYRDLFWTRQHQLAWSMLEFAVERLAPVTLITGEIGVGKTTLIRLFLDRQPVDLTVGLLSSLGEGRGDLYESVLNAFDQPLTDASTVARMRRLQDFVIEEYARGRRTVLIVDEAHNASDADLEGLRLLTNINADQNMLFQLMLVGHPDLRDRLARPECDQIVQRIGGDAHIGPMTADETAGYVRHRLELADGPPDLFDDMALKAVHYFAEGIPRKVNTLCELSLTKAFAEQRLAVDGGLVRRVIEEARESGVFAALTGGRGTLTGPRRENTRQPVRRVPERVARPEADPAVPEVEGPRPTPQDSLPGDRADPAADTATPEIVGREPLAPDPAPGVPRRPAGWDGATAGGRASPRWARDLPMAAGSRDPERPAAPPSPPTSVPIDPGHASGGGAGGAGPASGPGVGAAAAEWPRRGPRRWAVASQAAVLLALAGLGAGLGAGVVYVVSGQSERRAAVTSVDGTAAQPSSPAPTAGTAAGPDAAGDRAVPGAPAALVPTAFEMAGDPSSVLRGALPAEGGPTTGTEAAAPRADAGLSAVSAPARRVAATAATEASDALATRRFRVALDLAAEDARAGLVAFSGAALLGHSRAAYYLGQMFETGDGVPRDTALARAWYAAAAEAHPQARQRLETIDPPRTDGAVGAPILLDAGVTGDGAVELVWASGHGANPAAYVVELAAAPDEAPLVSRRLVLSATRMDLPPGAALWRVRAELPQGVGAAASDWLAIPPAVGPGAAPGRLPGGG